METSVWVNRRFKAWYADRPETADVDSLVSKELLEERSLDLLEEGG